MTVTEESGGRLILTYDSSRFARFIFIVAIVFAGAGVFERFRDRPNSDRVIGLLAGAATLMFTAFGMFEQAHAVVDPAARTIVWRTRWAYQRRGGTLSFDDVRGIFAERPIGDDGVPSRRVVIRTTGGERIPLTVGYRTDSGDALLHLARRLDALAGGDTATQTSRTAEMLVADGQTIQAIKQLRDSEGLSFGEAKQRVDAMKTKKGGSEKTRPT